MHVRAFRLTPGTDLKVELARLANAQQLHAGCILTCVGSLSTARLRMPGRSGEPNVVRTFEGPMEIVSLTGTLACDGMHVHVSLALQDGTCIGGHLVEGCVVHTTAELVIGELTDVMFLRRPDPATGYAELTVAPRPPDQSGGSAAG